MCIRDRFESKIHYCPTTGCWLWSDVLNGRGYGHLTFNRKVYLAHRFSWELHRGPITDGLFVCHKCDVRSCVNPDHLFLGTCKDNLQDMGRKGRSAMQSNPEARRKVGLAHQGERNTTSRLTTEQVLGILALRPTKRGDVAREARRLGVHSVTVSDVLNGRTWTHLNREV